MNNTIDCIIIEDEPVARNILRNYCGQLPFLRIVAEFGNALEAKTFLETGRADLIFLDIHMPVLDGIGFLHTLKDPPQVIFTTAYQEYALNAFDLGASDYLLKPISLERFIIAVDRAKQRLQPAVQDQPDNGSAIFIKSDGKTYKLAVRDCLFAEAKGNYTKLVTENGILLTKMPFSTLVSLLPTDLFCQTHRSFCINKSRVSHLEGNRVFVQQYEIPVAASYKESFLKAIGL